MKTAFEEYKDTIFKTSPYAGYDSIDTYYGKLLVLLSPLKDVPMKEVWMKQKINKEKASLLTGDIIFLKEPIRYMGYTVTPNPLLETRNKGHIKSEESSVFSYCADFFSFMSTITGGSWTRRAKGGAKLLGNLIDMDSHFNTDSDERTFSVLLYEKTKAERGMDGTYGLELLSPKKPDGPIQRAFGKMQWFVRKLPYGTYRPLYTTDFRILTGRYYRVTVNRCGWLVEDYLDINH